MPIREYSCECGHIFEVVIRSHRDEPSHCPQCESKKFVKLISPFGGYQGNTGSASTKPRGAGSFKGRVRK